MFVNIVLMSTFLLLSSLLLRVSSLGESVSVATNRTSESDISNSKPKRVAVVGAGIGGAAFAYYYAKQNEGVEIDVFEKRDYVGGRLKHVVLFNQTVEIGGDAWSTAANPYIVALAKKLGQTRTVNSGALKLKDPATNKVAVWTGAKLISMVDEDLSHPADVLRLVDIEAMFLKDLHTNYNERGTNGTFASVEEFTNYGDISKYTTTRADAYFNLSSVSQDIQRDQIEPLTRTIYDQYLDQIHAFAAVVAITSVVGADSFDGGNSLLVQKMFTAAGARVHLSTPIVSVQRNENNNKQINKNKNNNNNKNNTTTQYRVTTSKGDAGDYDAVIVASPIEFVNITFPSTTIVPPHRVFVHNYITVVRASGLRPQYFGMAADEKVGYDNILTSKMSGSVCLTPTITLSITRKMCVDCPFEVVQYEAGLPDGSALWKLFSNVNITDILPQIFIDLAPSDTVVQYWPYTFPQLVPVTNSTAPPTAINVNTRATRRAKANATSPKANASAKANTKGNTNASANASANANGVTYQPLKLDDNLFYLNTMESVASAMEGSIIAGRNIALLLANTN